MNAPLPLFLVGPMGAGKTTIGRKLAHALDMTFVDMDLLLEERTGVTVAHIFEVEGEEGFRERESRLLQELSEQPRQVISTGGGIIKRAENRQHLVEHGTVVYLNATFRILWNRLKNCQTRPLLLTGNPKVVLGQLLEERTPLYTQVADITFQVNNDSANKSVKQIVNLLASEF